MCWGVRAGACCSVRAGAHVLERACWNVRAEACVLGRAGVCWAVPSLWRGGAWPAAAKNISARHSVVSLSPPDTALCALPHDSSVVVCLSYNSVVFLASPASRGPPLPPSVYTPKGLRIVKSKIVSGSYF